METAEIEGGPEIARLALCFAALFALAVAGISCAAPTPYAEPPHYDHIVIVVEENHSAYQLGGAVYLRSLAARGASFLRMYALTHPSQPNYIALFSGSTQGILDDGLHAVDAPNLCTSLIAAGWSFAGYAEGLPTVDYAGETSGRYVRKHAPWVSFAHLPSGTGQPFTTFEALADYAALPAVSFVIPDLDHDMHDGSIQEADDWLAAHVDAYARWAVDHHSLLIVTFDEPYGLEPPALVPIATWFVGAGVLPGTSVPEAYTLYSLLRFVEDSTGLPYLGEEAHAAVIRGPWG